MPFFLSWVMASVILLSSAIAPNHSFYNAHASAIHITMDGKSSCSATAIGPHALLTATHCLVKVKTINLDSGPLQVLQSIDDKHDHTIVLVSNTFKDWAKIETRKVEVGDWVYIFGNPGNFRDILREGVIAGYNKNPDATFFDFNGFFGDSGSGVFDANGKIIDVVSFFVQQKNKDGNEWRIIAGLPLSFTDQEIDFAAHFAGK